MGLECSECERDLRGGHDKTCSRYDKSSECPSCGRTDYFQYTDGSRQCESCGRTWTPGITAAAEQQQAKEKKE